MLSTLTERIAVFLDFQNVHLVGRGLFDSGCELHRCVPDPVRIADLIASRRKRSSTAEAIRVYRGRPDPNHQPVVTASNDAQASRWTRDTHPPTAQLPQRKSRVTYDCPQGPAQS